METEDGKTEIENESQEYAGCTGGNEFGPPVGGSAPKRYLRCKGYFETKEINHCTK